MQTTTQNRPTMLHLCCAAFAAAFLTATGPASAETTEQTALDVLRAGGYALVMRHADSPHDQMGYVGLSDGCTLADGRGLSGKGLLQARMHGAFLVEQNVSILKAYTSKMCRAWDTAALAAGGVPVSAHPSQISTDPAVVAAFKKEIADELSRNPGQNIILSSHSNIAPLYGAYARDDEEEVPSGVIFVIDPADWSPVMSIRINLDISPQTVTVE